MKTKAQTKKQILAWLEQNRSYAYQNEKDSVPEHIKAHYNGQAIAYSRAIDALKYGKLFLL
jgi:hypothetical protein